MYFCVKCGKKIKSGVFCSEHVEKKSFTEHFNLSICECGRGKVHNRWTKYSSPQSFLKKVLTQ